MASPSAALSVLPVDPKVAMLTELTALELPIEKLKHVLEDDREGWSFSNMYAYAGADVINQAAQNAIPSLYDFRAITVNWLIFCPIVIVCFVLANQLFRIVPGIKSRFLGLNKDERLIAVFHSIFAVSFTAKMIPQTVWTVHLLWGPSFAVQFHNTYRQLWGCAVINAILYAAEGIARSTMRVNAFLLAHHITYFVMFIVPVARQSVWGSKLIMLLDCCIVLSEAPLYIALLAHRFIISTRKVRIITSICLAWSAAVRIAELVVLVAYFAGTYTAMHFWGEIQMWGWYLALCIPGGCVAVIFSFGIFLWFLIKRGRDPEKYGAARYKTAVRALPASGAASTAPSRKLRIQWPVRIEV